MGVASSWNELVEKNVICLTQKVMTHVWDKLFFFIHYNVQYMRFIVTYITLIWKHLTLLGKDTYGTPI